MMMVVRTTRPRRWMMSSVNLNHDTFIDINFFIGFSFFLYKSYGTKNFLEPLDV